MNGHLCHRLIDTAADAASAIGFIDTADAASTC